MDDLFISRAGEDVGWGLWIAQALSEAGYLVRLQDWHFPAGADFIDLSGRGVRECRWTLCLYSPSYLARSTYTLKERNQAIELGSREKRVRMIPIVVKQCVDETLTATTIYCDLSTRFDEAAARTELLAQIEKACGRPSGPPDPTRRGHVPFPLAAQTLDDERRDLIVHLCDRDDQEEELRDALSKWTRFERPLVCILSGEEDHLGEKFVERLPTSPLPDCLGRARDFPIELEVLPWPRIARKTTCEKFQQDLNTEVSRAMLHEASDDRPTVVQCDFLADDWCNDEARTSAFLETFVQYWEHFPVDPPRLFLVCLTVRFRRVIGGAPGEAERELQKKHLLSALARIEKERDLDRGCLFLPPLSDVKRPRAQHWTTLPEVLQIRKIENAEINLIYTAYNTDALVMERLAPELRRLLY